MNILDTAHAVAHTYPGGCESLAPRLGVSAAVLRSKVNPNTDTHKLTLQEAVRISEVTDNDAILEAWASERGYALVKLPSAVECCDAAIVELMGKAWSTHGLVGREIVKTLEDGRVEHSEVVRVEARIFQHAQVLFNLAARLRGMAE
ncbi:phage regulatory CII family protein [Burkholderia pseudomallei ABCPW 30]|uniref:phage regulatory CII family protein n=1 Tax=Burkholderia pseudomallei TaxID=28450 RepID=UPI000538F9CE|nr:phage regulatory CII family protein [Burkholderia pseudomallei]KGV90510.1 phage regulatory CII family protein [Burkholderia pseudomallei ABCPW 30]